MMWVILFMAKITSTQTAIGQLTINPQEFMQADVTLVGILL